MKDNNLQLGPPIGKKALSEAVVQRIVGLIRSRVLKPGAQLPPERDLAASLGVSRPSLREALRALSILGILEIRQGDGIYVSSLSPEALLAPLDYVFTLEPHHLDALFEARLILEPGITWLAAARADDKAVEALRRCIENEANYLDDEQMFLESDLTFHQIIEETSGNPFLQRVALNLRVLGRASREITGRLPGVRRQSHEDHKEILNAIAARDPEAASNAMKRHLQNVQKAYHRYKEESGSWGLESESSAPAGG